MKARVDYLTNFDLSTDETMSKFLILFLQRFVRSLRGTGTGRHRAAHNGADRPQPTATGTGRYRTCPNLLGRDQSKAGIFWSKSSL